VENEWQPNAVPGAALALAIATFPLRDGTHNKLLKDFEIHVAELVDV
jgi:hypothetical protein